MSDPLKPLVEAIRATILGADSQITEGVKWNSPSFYRHGWFATVNVRPTALVSFASAEDFESKRKAFAEIIKQWVAEQARLAEAGQAQR